MAAPPLLPPGGRAVLQIIINRFVDQLFQVHAPAVVHELLVDVG
ncbi:hypothetical protein [Hymenobacter sp. BRD67]|nr:hypothetical protein [Hymenobacter sp. BRD67]